MSMSDLISREYLINKIAKLENEARKMVIETPRNKLEFLTYMGQLNERSALKHEIMGAPTVEAKEVVHGEWIMRGGRKYCTNCGKKALEERDRDDWYGCVESNFCPNCGSKMKG